MVAVPTAGQSLIEDKALVGHCVNFLPIRNDWTPETSFADHLRSVGERVLDAYEHQGTTLGTIVRKLAPRREINRLPLTELQFNLERLASRIEGRRIGNRGRTKPQSLCELRYLLEYH